jgi:hypothetical protein
MILQKQHLCSLALLVGAVGLTVAPASAQQTYKATVDLPAQTRWGGVVLHAGRHEVVLEDGSDGVSVIQVSGQGDLARILTGPIDYKPLSDRSTLQIVSAGGEYVVTHFNVGSRGKSFSFAVPKGKRNSIEAAAQSETIVSLSANP